MSTNRTVSLKVLASIGTIVPRPDTDVANLPIISLKTMIPKQFGNWCEELRRSVSVVNAQTQALLGKLCSPLLSRVSSIDGDQDRGNRPKDQFVNHMLQAIPPGDRKRLSGLGTTALDLPRATQLVDAARNSAP